MDIFPLDLLILCLQAKIYYTSLSLSYDFNKNDNIILNFIKKQWTIYFCYVILQYKMSSMYSNLSNQTRFGLNKINKILLQKFKKEKQWVKD